MAKKAESAEAKRYRVLKKLFSSGCRTEKDLMALSIDTVLKMDTITIPEMVIILEIQKHVKKHTLFSYLGQKEENEVERHT